MEKVLGEEPNGVFFISYLLLGQVFPSFRWLQQYMFQL